MNKQKSIWDLPYTIYANVLLMNGKIINWKTGRTHWDSVEKAMHNRQPIGLMQQNKTASFSIQSIAIECEKEGDNTFAFETASVQFYKNYPIYEKYPENMAKPYYEDTDE